MISLFFQYGVILLWTLLLAINTRIFKIPSNFIYAFLGVALLFSLLILYKNSRILKQKSFLPLTIIIIINFIYWALFDQTYNSMLYVLAKTSTFLLIMISVYYYYDFLVKNFAKIVIYIGAFVLIVGLIINTHYFGGRYTGPFGNPNSLGWLSSLLFGLVYLTAEKSYKKYVLLLLFFAMVMMSGSRAALGGVVLAILLKGSISFNKVFILALGLSALLVAQNIASNFGIHTGLERIIKSEKSNDLLSGRDKEYTLGLLTIKEAPLTGHGLDKYAWISPHIVKISGLLRKDPFFVGNPHNSYIAMFIMYGIPLGLFVFLMLSFYVVKIFLSRIQRQEILFMTLFSFIAATFESYIFGVSGFEGLIFWFSLTLGLAYIERSKKTSPLRKQYHAV
ncbi:O-antigen ligase family protein [Hydrogenimonas sp.]